MLKVSPTAYCYNIYIIYTTWTDFFLNHFESELFHRDVLFIKNVSFVETRKNVIYSKLVNNPFKQILVGMSEQSEGWDRDTSPHILTQRLHKKYNNQRIQDYD